MKIVIDIDKGIREHILDLANDGNEIPLGINAHMIKAIANGKPLSEYLLDWKREYQYQFYANNIKDNKILDLAKEDRPISREELGLTPSSENGFNVYKEI